MATVGIFCVPRDSALVNPVDRFLDEQYVKTRVLAQGGALWGFSNINISAFTP